MHAGIQAAFCPPPKSAAPAAPAATPVDPALEPTRVFDNLYFVGDRTTSVWALTSADRFMTLDPTVDVELSNHVVADGTVAKLALLKARKPDAPHPFVSGNAGFREWAGVLRSCAQAFLP